MSWYQKGKTNLDFTEARDSEWQWHQLGHMQTICTSLHTDNHASTPPRSFCRPDALPAGQPSVKALNAHSVTWRHYSSHISARHSQFIKAPLLTAATLDVYVLHFCCPLVLIPLSPQVDTVMRIRGKVIRPFLCCVLYYSQLLLAAVELNVLFLQVNCPFMDPAQYRMSLEKRLVKLLLLLLFCLMAIFEANLAHPGLSYILFLYF